jgi:HlyD family secretion protein
MRTTTIVLLVIAVIVLAGVGFYLTNPEAAERILVNLGLATPKQEGYTASGMLEARTYRLASERGGMVEAVWVMEGEEVSEGRGLAQLETESIQLELDAARARLTASQEALDMLQADPRPADQAAAEAAVAQAQTILDGAELALEDALDLPRGDTRDEQVALATAQETHARAWLQAMEAALQALLDGASQEAIRAAEAARDAAAAEVGALQAQLRQQTIAAPIDGVVLQRLLLPGELALPGWPVVVVADLSEMRLSVYLPEADLGWASVGAAVVIKVDAYPEREFAGEVIDVAEEAEFTPRNVQTPEERSILVYQVRIKIPNPEGLLKPGLPADANFEVQP